MTFPDSLRDHTFMTSTGRGAEGGGVLKFVRCFWILFFLNNTSIVHFCRWWWWEGRRVKKLVIFSGRHKSVTPNLKLSFELMLITITKNLLLNNLKIKNYCNINLHSETWRIEAKAYLGPPKTSTTKLRLNWWLFLIRVLLSHFSLVFNFFTN